MASPKYSPSSRLSSLRISLGCLPAVVLQVGCCRGADGVAALIAHVKADRPLLVSVHVVIAQKSRGARQGRTCRPRASMWPLRVHGFPVRNLREYFAARAS